MNLTFLYAILIALVLFFLTSCASLLENSWQNNPCTYKPDSDACKHKKYTESIKR